MAATGFFQRQANARRNTMVLILLFTLAVAGITLAVSLVGYFVTRGESSHLPFHQWLLSRHGLLTAAAVVLVISAGSLVRWIDLAGGGEKVAELVGARELDPETRNPEEQRLQNIAEEMAIASGVPVPRLYVMDSETGINAFVAGYGPGEAVMVVTHGALTHLNRDELQGVVGHEFSHVLNGDMRLNIRLLALLAGILMIGQIGAFFLHSFRYRRMMSRGRNNAQGAVIVLGLALIAVGYIGLFFGRLIQAAVSRQREMLADASAVQFTRNPEGIAGALYRIGQQGSHLENTRHASDMNHLCLSESIPMAFTRLLASHPPLEKRIEAISPGLLVRLRHRPRGAAEPEAARTGAAGPAPAGPLPAQASGFAGTLTPENRQTATDLLSGIPAGERQLLHSRSGAIHLCYALLLDGLDSGTRSRRLSIIDQPAPFRPDETLIERLLALFGADGRRLRMPALELATPALRLLDPEQRQTLLTLVNALIGADGRLSLFEYAMASYLKRHLAAGAQRDVPTRYRRYQAVAEPLQQLFSLVARASAADGADAETLYRQAMAGFEERAVRQTAMSAKVTLGQLQQALGELNRLSPLLKPAVIDACAHCILSDRQVTAQEYDLLRLVADQLDAPMPPLAA